MLGDADRRKVFSEATPAPSFRRAQVVANAAAVHDLGVNLARRGEVGVADQDEYVGRYAGSFGAPVCPRGVVEKAGKVCRGEVALIAPTSHPMRRPRSMCSFLRAIGRWWRKKMCGLAGERAPRCRCARCVVSSPETLGCAFRTWLRPRPLCSRCAGTGDLWKRCEGCGSGMCYLLDARFQLADAACRFSVFVSGFGDGFLQRALCA